jgi:putative ABC transport system permease protein
MLKIIMSAVGTVILVLACLNYMNMATARSAKRSLEVGVRKVMGAYRLQLVHQFLSESLIVCTVSFCLGILWADLAIPAFNAFTGWKLNMSSFFTDYRLVLTLAAFNVLLAIIAGSYPAFFLSRFIPAKVLKGQTSADASRRLRKGLVLAQFSITTVLVVMVIVVFRQFNYLRTKDLGFDKDQLLLFDASLSQNLSTASFKEELKQAAGVEIMASASSFPGSGLSNTEMRPSLAPDKNLQIDWMFADHDYIPTLRLKLLAGRNFNASGYDQDRGVIINAQAAASFGWKPEEAVGKKVSGFIFTDSLPGEVIGVIANFHVTSLKKEMSPLVIGYQSSGDAFIARLGAGNIFEARNKIEKTVTKLVPGTIFDAMFMDDFVEQMYMSEKKTGQMIGFFTVLAILVGCSGLFALSAYEGEQRIKELGIRKIMGATSVQLIVMLSKNFLKLVGLSLIIAFPLAYFVTGLWLQPFPYRISWSADIFLLAGASILLLAWMTVVTQAIRSSRLNPADALRHE